MGTQTHYHTYSNTCIHSHINMYIYILPKHKHAYTFFCLLVPVHFKLLIIFAKNQNSKECFREEIHIFHLFIPFYYCLWGIKLSRELTHSLFFLSLPEV